MNNSSIDRAERRRAEVVAKAALDEQGAFCANEEAVLQVRRWDATTEEPVEIRFTDLASTRFLADGQSLVIAFAPMNASIPNPLETRS